MDKKRKSEFVDKKKTKRRRTELSSEFWQDQPQTESADEPSDSYSVSSNKAHVAGNNNNVTQYVTVNNSGIVTIASPPIDPKIPKIHVPRDKMKYQIGCIITDVALDESMALFTLSKHSDQLECARQIINFNGASTVLFTHSSWMVFVMNTKDGWTEPLRRQFHRAMFPDLTVNLKRNEKNNETLFPKYIGSRPLMLPPAEFWEWKYFCDCKDKDSHHPKVVENAPYFSNEDIIPGNNYTIFYPDRHVATCCASWIFSSALVNRHKYEIPIKERSVMVELTIKADLTDSNFILNLNTIAGGADSIYVLLEKTNSTRIIAVLQPQAWVSIWASYYSGNTGKNGVQYVRPPTVLSWIDLPTPAVALASAASDRTAELSLVADCAYWNSLQSVNSVQSLSLLDARWSVAQFTTITKLVKLDTLRLDYCHELSNECLLNLVDLKLTSLSVNGCQWFDNESWKYLRQIKTLKELSLRNCYRITRIDGLSFVDVLDVSGCWQIFGEAIQDFKKKCPYIRVIKQFEYATNPMDVVSNYDWMDIYREQIQSQSP